MTDEPQDPQPGDPRQQGVLHRLIAERMHELGRSYRDVAERGGLSRSTVHYLATRNGSGGIPRPATLEALAQGLDLPVSVVRAAAAASAGLYVEAVGAGPAADPETEVLIASLAKLNPAERRHVAALVRSLLGSREAGEDPQGSRR